MLLLSVSTKKRKHNWEITKRDLTKLTSPSVRTKNDWSRRASGQKIGYLNSRTLRSVRLLFFLLLTGRIEPVAPEGRFFLPSLFQCSQCLKSTKEALSRFFEAAPTMRTFMRRLTHLLRCNSCLCCADFLPQLRRSTSFCGVPPRVDAPPVRPAVLLPSAHEKTRHSPRGRVSRRGGVECCRHATATPHRQFSTERACCSNRARSRSCAHRASACCRERVRGTCGGRTHRASQRRPCG